MLKTMRKMSDSNWENFLKQEVSVVRRFVVTLALFCLAAGTFFGLILGLAFGLLLFR